MRKLLLIEDNHDLGALFAAKARVRGLSLEVFESLGDMGSVGRLGAFDAAIIDFNLGGVNGIEISQYIERFFGEVPVVLISAHPIAELPMQRHWPASIRRFLAKDEGVDAILDAAETAATEASWGKAASGKPERTQDNGGKVRPV